MRKLKFISFVPMKARYLQQGKILWYYRMDTTTLIEWKLYQVLFVSRDALYVLKARYPEWYLTSGRGIRIVINVILITDNK